MMLHIFMWMIPMTQRVTGTTSSPCGEICVIMPDSEVPENPSLPHIVGQMLTEKIPLLRQQTRLLLIGGFFNKKPLLSMQTGIGICILFPMEVDLSNL